MDDAAESEDIRTRINRFSCELFRCHIVQRANDHALAGQKRCWRLRVERHAAGWHDVFGQTEIQDFGAIRGEHHVSRLEVSVHDPLLVCPVDRASNGSGNLHCLFKGKRPSLEPVKEGLPVEELHHQEIDVTLVTHVVESADIRMRQLRNRACLLLEPCAKIGITSKSLRQHLDRDRASEPDVSRSIDLSHAAFADGLEDFVVSELLSWFQRHRRRL